MKKAMHYQHLAAAAEEAAKETMRDLRVASATRHGTRPAEATVAAVGEAPEAGALADAIHALRGGEAVVLSEREAGALLAELLRLRRPPAPAAADAEVADPDYADPAVQCGLDKEAARRLFIQGHIGYAKRDELCERIERHYQKAAPAPPC